MSIHKILFATYDLKAHSSGIQLLQKCGYEVEAYKNIEDAIRNIQKKNTDLLILTSRIGAEEIQYDSIGRKLTTFEIPIKLADEALKIDAHLKLLYLDSVRGCYFSEYQGKKTTISDFVEERGGAVIKIPEDPLHILSTIKNILEK